LVLLAAEDAGKEAWLLWLVGVTLAALALRNTGEGLLDVVTATGPGWLSALAAGYFLAHGLLHL
jgi:hypothetical protein